MDTKSISGYACIIDGACIAWSSKKQGTMALSTTEAEYIVLTHAAKQMTWTRHLLNEIGLEQRDLTPIHCDNLSVITITHNATYYVRTKHIKIYYHFICERVASNEALLIYIASKDNIVDIMTKAIPPDNHQSHQIKGAIRNYKGSNSLRGSVGSTTRAYMWTSRDSEVTWCVYTTSRMRAALKRAFTRNSAQRISTRTLNLRINEGPGAACA